MTHSCDWCGGTMPKQETHNPTHGSILICPGCVQDLSQALASNGLRSPGADDLPSVRSLGLN